jgi:5-oxoprolinase (ATP-hydrolysing)
LAKYCRQTNGQSGRKRKALLRNNTGLCSVTFSGVNSNGKWQFWIDRGGTFTDVVAVRPDGALETAKLLSENPERYNDAAAAGISEILQHWADAGHADAPLEAIKMGTTVATNALLERKGEPTVLIVTRGYADSLAIGYQNRPDIFALNIVRPPVLYARVIEVEERIDASGNVLVEADERSLTTALQQCAADGIESAAICLMHGYKYPAHEKRVAALARQSGFDHVSVSHEIEPVIKFISRAETTLADAYLTPVLSQYILRLKRELQEIATPERLLFMQSNGGLVDAEFFRGKNSVLSGPAAGVVGMVESAKAAGFEKLVGFDMGGTSTDVSSYRGTYERSNDSEIAGVKLRTPMMKVHTIAAGGSSILRFEDQRFQVGPESAGANPGPACYRRGGPLTVTDANVCLGRIPGRFFPQLFGASGDQAIDSDIVNERFNQLAENVSRSARAESNGATVAAGFITVAVENMANAIRKITIEQGEDVRDFTLCCFGGAAGQHACQVADVLGIRTIWLHPMAGVLSAYGMGLSDIRVERQQTIELDLSPLNERSWREVAERTSATCDAALAEQNVPQRNRRFSPTLGLRVDGSDTVIDVPLDDLDTMRAAFDALYRRRFGTIPDRPKLIVATVMVAAEGKEASFSEPLLGEGHAAKQQDKVQAWMDDQWMDVPVFRRTDLPATATITGPAIIIEDHSTTVLDPGWSGRVDHHGHLVIESDSPAEYGADTRSTDTPDPVRLEVFNQLFMHIAEQMGVVLQNTALSVNIRERLDFSCALFDAEGRLVSNAPHMPVHLGSMGESVRSVITNVGSKLTEGDAIMLNSPYNGGTHLPDITVVTPWFSHSDTPLFYFASRAHHADIGGSTPGSMPSTSTHIDEEGVLIDNFFLVRNGRFREAEVLALLEDAKYPARNPRQNVADLRAQLAANQQGIRQIEKTIDRYGLATVQSYLKFVRENAADCVRRLLNTLIDGDFRYEMDSGEAICVSISVDQDKQEALIDFSGTSPQSESNFNAPEAVSRAAVLYVFRSLIDERIPMNEGCLDPLHIRIPEGSMLSPSWPAAVVAGNVETSQCVTDALYGALGVLAASQGTMNNLSFGNDKVQYYETIAGGAGAGNGFDGADAVQTHMTNSRLTDPEVLEKNLPVLLESYSIRRGSGGPGRWHGGNGAVRVMRFTESLSASILSNHRRVAPFGMAGGDDGKVGRNTIIRNDGTSKSLSATATVELEQGDKLVIETPGGGGYGSRKQDSA